MTVVQAFALFDATWTGFADSHQQSLHQCSDCSDYRVIKDFADVFVVQICRASRPEKIAFFELLEQTLVDGTEDTISIFGYCFADCLLQLAVDRAAFHLSEIRDFMGEKTLAVFKEVDSRFDHWWYRRCPSQLCPSTERLDIELQTQRDLSQLSKADTIFTCVATYDGRRFVHQFVASSPQQALVLWTEQADLAAMDLDETFREELMDTTGQECPRTWPSTCSIWWFNTTLNSEPLYLAIVATIGDAPDSGRPNFARWR